MPRLLVITQGEDTKSLLQEGLLDYGFSCLAIDYDDSNAFDAISDESPDLVLVEMDQSPSDSGPWELIKSIKQGRQVPVIALLPRKVIPAVKNQLHADDFISTPFNAAELVLRINQLLKNQSGSSRDEIITSDGMVIDTVSCDVTIFGKRVELTFREYELLKFLASNKGRVFSREELLNKVWGYDFFGGDRTVDTHIRRLRSKTEDPNHSFIETVRNIGYRFKQDS